jgi:DNA-binding MarR family transcriptional regulator
VGLELTDEGLRVLKSARSRRTAWLAKRLGRLSPEERAAIDDVIDPLLRLLDDAE